MVLAFSLSLLTPLLVVVYIGIKCSSNGPLFFCQTRVGVRGRLFSILKFRTMHVDVTRSISQTSNWGEGVFAFGGFLRRFKIDELPQIINIIRGDMSFVGPRPCLPDTFSRMPEWAKKRLELRPGLTGLAQINGNTKLSWEDRWRYDIQYVNKVGFLYDTSILLSTILVVVQGEVKRVPSS